MADTEGLLQGAAVRMRRVDVDALFRRADRALKEEPSTAPRRCLARAPGRLDVIGGIAEYTGALVIGSSLADGVSVTVRRRGDGRVVLHGLSEFAEPDPEPAVFDLSALRPDTPPKEFAAALPDSLWVRAAAGAIHAMIATRKIDGSEAGLSVVVDSAIPPLVDAGVAASVAVALIMAATQVWDLKFDPAECAQLALRAENDVVGHSCGIGAAACALHARAGGLTQINCLNHTVQGVLPVPEQLVILGVDTGFKYADANEKYDRARTATFMGRLLIDRIVKAVGGFPFRWNGSLAELSVADYVEHLRDRMPTKIKGIDFLERLGETSDPLTRIEPDRVYKIRSRTEHHIYEAERTHRFAERLSYVARTGDRSALLDAGRLMYASHWSYGQRCGLGSVETDRLITLLRARGGEAGVYGARVTAQGAGGIVAVMLDATAKARQVLDEVIVAYERLTSRTATVLDAVSPGAIEFGVHAS